MSFFYLIIDFQSDIPCKCKQSFKFQHQVDKNANKIIVKKKVQVQYGRFLSVYGGLDLSKWQ